ncbi:MAG: ACP S-malonyltransferase [Gammaproteobacteria bacterium]|nr:ACP S-malonyltransferase [Gammaproteobacteria bacterium]
MSSAFIFPGQGSQSVGMMGAFAQQSIVRDTFDEASDVLGYELWDLIEQGPEAELNQTEQTQPAMLAAGVATWRLWTSLGGSLPQRMAGHSLGEYTALVCAGALSFADAVQLVAARGRFMQEAVPAGMGAMAAILMLEDDVVRSLCAENAGEDVVQAVNFNSPGQVVVAGHKGAVERVIEAAMAAGAKKAVMLPMSVPSHCDLMKPAAERLAELLAETEICSPSIKVIQNADVASVSDPDQIRDALTRQLYMPVRWVETIQAIKATGVEALYECGPGKVLAGLNRRIEKRMPVHTLISMDDIEKALKAASTEAGA